MTDWTDWDTFRQLAAEVAGELGHRRLESWTVTEWHEDSDWPAAILAPEPQRGPEHARIKIRYGHDCTGKITATGVLPEGTCHRRAFTRNVSPERGAKAIALTIDTYILRVSYGYLDLLPEKVEQKRRTDERQAARAAVMARFAALVEAEPSGGSKLSLSPYLPMRGEVSLDHHAEYGEDQPRVSLELHGLDIATALAMVEVFAASDGARGRCCRQYGTGHDQRLSLLGCLRAAARDSKPTYEEGDALYGLYLAAGDTSVPWEDWLGDTEVQAAWR